MDLWNVHSLDNFVNKRSSSRPCSARSLMLQTTRKVSTYHSHLYIVTWRPLICQQHMLDRVSKAFSFPFQVELFFQVEIWLLDGLLCQREMWSQWWFSVLDSRKMFFLCINLWLSYILLRLSKYHIRIEGKAAGTVPLFKYIVMRRTGWA